jgi:hypothetical protein
LEKIDGNQVYSQINFSPKSTWIMDDQAAMNPESWVDQYGDMLFQFAYSRVGKADVAEELVQETFLAAIRAQKKFEGRSTEKTWLYSILKHKTIDHFRNKKKYVTKTNDKDYGEITDQIFAIVVSVCFFSFHHNGKIRHLSWDSTEKWYFP